MNLAPSPFEMIKSGEKTIELRLYDEKRRAVGVGDTIEFTSAESGEKISARVKAIHVLIALRSFTVVFRLKNADIKKRSLRRQALAIWKSIILRRSRRTAVFAQLKSNLYEFTGGYLCLNTA